MCDLRALIAWKHVQPGRSGRNPWFFTALLVVSILFSLQGDSQTLRAEPPGAVFERSEASAVQSSPGNSAPSPIPPAAGDAPEAHPPVTVAVEFTSHAAAAFVAMEKGWFGEAGLQIRKFDCYVTGTALSAALARGDVEMALMCLSPAINAYKNGKVPLKIVAGLHEYGYGMVGNPKKIRSLDDLTKKETVLACVNEGSATDVVFHKVFQNRHLPFKDIMARARRMPPPKAILALETGLVDAVLCPEHYVSKARNSGFAVMLNMEDLEKVWPGLQGSVVIVTETFLQEHPETVRAFVNVIARSIGFLNTHPDEAAPILARAFSEREEEIFPREISDACKATRTDETAFKESITKGMVNRIQLNLKSIQEVIDYMVFLGYIPSFSADEIVDQRFLPPSSNEAGR